MCKYIYQYRSIWIFIYIYIYICVYIYIYIYTERYALKFGIFMFFHRILAFPHCKLHFVVFRIFCKSRTVFSYFLLVKTMICHIFRIFRTFREPRAARSDCKCSPKGSQKCEKCENHCFYKQKMRKNSSGLAKNAKNIKM